MKKMDLSINENNIIRLPDGRPPVGNNFTPALSSYCNKKLYERDAFRPIFANSPNVPINILYNKPFYGKVNLNNDPVVVIDSALNTKFLGDKKIILLDFVMDAQREFFYYWDFLKNKNKITPNSSLYNLEISTSLVGFDETYFNYMESIYTKFRNFLVNSNTEITNLEHFVDRFIAFFETVSINTIYTFSSFILSKMADPHISGMCFQVKTLDITDDLVKYQNVLLDPNYVIFKKTAMKYGFCVDKHIPWRLYADLDSPAMKPYMDKYSLTQDNIYNKNFQLAINYDLFYLRKYILNFYNAITANNRIVKINKFEVCKLTGNSKVQHEEVFVPFLEENVLSQDKTFINLIMRLYVYLKGRENNYSWDQTSYENTVRTFIEIKDALDIRSAMKYIWPLVKAPAETEEIRRNFHFKRG